MLQLNPTMSHFMLLQMTSKKISLDKNQAAKCQPLSKLGQFINVRHREVLRDLHQHDT